MVLDGARVMIDCRLLRFVGKRWVLRFLLLPLAVTPVAAQTITFHAVPPNATVQCLSNAPATLLTVTDAIPFGVTSGVLTGLSTGSYFVIGSDGIGSFTEGKLNLGNDQSAAAWQADMTTNGCGCAVSVGSIPTITGSLGVQQAFQNMGFGTIVTIPVVNDTAFTANSGTANIVGFIVAEMVNFATAGSNWSATLMILSGPTSAPNVTALTSCGSITNMVFHETLPNGNTNVIIRTWTASDSCGNSATATQLVTVADNQPPVINSCPGNIVTNTTGANGVIVTFAASATDNCGGSVAVSFTPASGSTFGLGVTPVNCSAVDAVGNQTNCTFYVAVLSPVMFQINSVAAQGNNLVVTWNMPHGCTGVVQAASGNIDGGYSSNTFSDVSTPILVPGNSYFTTNYLDLGAVTNSPSRFYRIHLVVPDWLVHLN